ncbi:hypothetical protein ACFLUZ_02880 [Chloroflexota bacterium]
MKRKILAALLVVLMMATIAPTAWAAGNGNARMPAIKAGADRVVELQRTDTGWEGTWYWTVGSIGNATNLTGVTALGLLEAYRDTKEPEYLDAAVDAADFLQAHLGIGATGTQHHVRMTAPDIVFLHRLSEVTGDGSYATRATIEWNNLTTVWPTAGDLDNLFRAISRPSVWDIAFFMEAADLSGDTTWADEAAAILADTDDDFYYGETWWYALNAAGVVRALVGCGYFETYNDEIVYLLGELISLIDDEGSIDGWVQDTAYAALAFSTVDGAGRRYANDLGRWLASHQEAFGGWIEEGWVECPEVNGEAVRALASTIGTNVTLDRIRAGKAKSSRWVKTVRTQAAIPFNGD